MAGYKQRARQLKHDAFRDTTVGLFERLGDRLEGKGRTILYALGAIVLFGLLLGAWSWWSQRRDNQAQRALGEAIRIAQAPVGAEAAAVTVGPKFSSKRERAERAVEAFQKVAAQYGNPYRDKARYLAAVTLLEMDRARGISELEALAKGASPDVAAWAKFALAQARAANGELDAALALYRELASARDSAVPLDDVKLRMAEALIKQGKRQEAVDLLFNLVETARTRLDSEGKPTPDTATVRQAAELLQRLDQARYAKLPPEPAPNLSPLANLPF
ncbi:MAG: hypothetical protein C4334_00380 [Pyrinomonas sp.]|uniref:hypothetical protein n=1 Tax=Pyrinomonas sp. TaxID=2080306 RepID=UPI00333012B6